MLVQNLVSTNYLSHANPVKHKENRDAEVISRKKGFSHNDAYIPSAALLKSQTGEATVVNIADPLNIKAKNLAEIRERIASGFYDSAMVNDDLTDVFSGMFKKSIA